MSGTAWPRVAIVSTVTNGFWRWAFASFRSNGRGDDVE
jgi:hypothetical protein